MMNVFRRRLSMCAVFAVTLVPALSLAQQKPETALSRQLARIDLAVNAAGSITSNTSGNTYLPQFVALSPSNTVGALAQIRYTKSSLIGAEFNYGFVRYTDNFTVSNVTGTPSGNLNYVLGAQTKVSEYSVAYIVHAPGSYFGLHPFGGVGVGGFEFAPTGGGGQGLPKEPRGVYLYELGADAALLGPDFGARVQFRQQFFGAPDFNQNYLANNKRSVTSQPTFGFWYRF